MGKILLQFKVSGARHSGAWCHWGNIPRAQCAGAGRQWDATSYGTKSLGQNPCGRTSVGQEVPGQEEGKQDLALTP